MPETNFVIFNDHHTRHAVKNITRQPLSNIENMGKTVSSGPMKLKEPMKKSTEPKKTFLSNTGKALQSTPARKVFTPRAVNVSSLIYNDENDEGCKMLDIEFTKPTFNYDNHKRDLFDFLLPEPELARHDESPPSTPPPKTRRYSMEQSSPYQEEFFTDDFSLDSLPDDDLGLPGLY